MWPAGMSRCCAGWGLRLLDAIEVETPGMRSGANGQSRMPAEMVFVFEREASELREPDGVEAH